MVNQGAAPENPEVHALRERIKELRALHAVLVAAADTSRPVETVLEAIATVLVPAMQWPERAVARVGVGRLVASSPAWRATAAELFAYGHTRGRERVWASIGYATSGENEAENRELGPIASLAGPSPFLIEEQQLLSSVLLTLVGHLERREVERQLREQQTLLDKARDAISVRDLGGLTEYWNGSAATLYGWPADGAGPRQVRTSIKDLGAYEEAMRELMGKGEWAGELELSGEGERHRLIHGHWSLVRGGDGERPARVLAIETDITESRRTQDQALRSQRLESLGRLAGGVAHDMNNLLSPILMTVSFLRQNQPVTELDEDLRTIETCALRGSQLVKRLVEFARGSVGEPRAVRLSNVVEEVARVIRETFPRDITIETDTSGERWELLADETQLHQLLMNLCVNARDALSYGGRLFIGLECIHLDAGQVVGTQGCEAGPYVVLRVEDTGVGMTPEVMAQVFEPFFTTRPGEGSGLGLSTVHAIVKGLRGFVDVYSEPGIGTRFKVCLPALVDKAEEGATAVEPGMVRGSGEAILLVEDEEPLRETALRILQRSGYRPIAAAHGVEAVMVLATRGAEIDLVVTDMAMPMMDGPATVVALRALRPELPIVVMSGLGGADQGRLRELEVDGFVPKPFSVGQFLEVIAAALRGKGRQVAERSS
jgi:signal transduction histidine kinase/ActR/RegA family two-component response regulator